jgi:hypothetical protein
VIQVSSNGLPNNVQIIIRLASWELPQCSEQFAKNSDTSARFVPTMAPCTPLQNETQQTATSYHIISYHSWSRSSCVPREWPCRFGAIHYVKRGAARRFSSSGMSLPFKMNYYRHTELVDASSALACTLKTFHFTPVLSLPCLLLT